MKLSSLPAKAASIKLPKKLIVAGAILAVAGLSAAVYADTRTVVPTTQPQTTVTESDTVQPVTTTPVFINQPAAPAAAPTVSSATASKPKATQAAQKASSTPQTTAPASPAPSTPTVPVMPPRVEPSFDVRVLENEASVDVLGQIYIPFEVVLKNGHPGYYGQPVTNILSGPDMTAISPTTMFGKESMTNGILKGFIGFVVYDNAVTGDYVCQLVITDGTTTVTENFVLHIVAE